MPKENASDDQIPYSLASLVEVKRTGTLGNALVLNFILLLSLNVITWKSILTKTPTMSSRNVDLYHLARDQADGTQHPHLYSSLFTHVQSSYGASLHSSFHSRSTSTPSSACNRASFWLPMMLSKHVVRSADMRVFRRRSGSSCFYTCDISWRALSYRLSANEYSAFVSWFPPILC